MKTGLKNFLKGLTVALLAAPLAAGLLAGHQVQAAEPTLGPGTAQPGITQPVLLTKLGFTSEQPVGPVDPAQPWQGAANQKVVPNVHFSVYDITADYWAQAKAGTFAGSDGKATDTVSSKAVNDHYQAVPAGLTPVADGTTDAQGQITFNLNTTNDAGKQPVYLFVEDDQGAGAAGYQKAANFVLSLPVGEKTTDGQYPTAYVYPKNVANATYDLHFRKVDAVSNTALGGATFVIKNGKLFAHVIEAKENTVTGFSSEPVEVEWVEDAQLATKFVSSETDGEFGFTAHAESRLAGVLHGLKPQGDYQYQEITAPAGYQLDGKEKDVKEDAPMLDVPNQPQGILPHTGGAGIIAFVIGGAALLTVGGLAYYKRRQA